MIEHIKCLKFVREKIYLHTICKRIEKFKTLISDFKNKINNCKEAMVEVDLIRRSLNVFRSDKDDYCNDLLNHDITYWNLSFIEELIDDCETFVSRLNKTNDIETIKSIKSKLDERLEKLELELEIFYGPEINFKIDRFNTIINQALNEYKSMDKKK